MEIHQFLVHQEQREQERLEALTPRRSTKSMSEAPAIQNEGAAGLNFFLMQDFIRNKTQFAHIPLPKVIKLYMGKPTPPHDIPNRLKRKAGLLQGQVGGGLQLFFCFSPLLLGQDSNLTSA